MKQKHIDRAEADKLFLTNEPLIFMPHGIWETPNHDMSYVWKCQEPYNITMEYTFEKGPDDIDYLGKVRSGV